MSNLETQALELAAAGFHVFPIKAGHKSPPITGWQKLATRDQAQIHTWWGNGASPNIGISTSKFGDTDALLVVDVDVKGSKNGNETLLRWEFEGRDLPPTYMQRTPTGGTHLVYKVSSPVRQSASVLGPGLDIRANGGYVVGKGSVLPAGVYTANDLPVADAPPWLIDLCGRAKERPSNAPKTVDVEINADRAAKRAIEYLGSAPIAVEGQGGDEATYKVAAQCMNFGLRENDCYLLMLEHWNDRCKPPWAPDDLKKKVRNAYEYGAQDSGSAAPEVDFAKPYSGDERTPGTRKLYTRSDDGNAELMADLSKGNLFYIHEPKHWMYYDKGQWKIAKTQGVARYYASLVANYYHSVYTNDAKKEFMAASSQYEKGSEEFKKAQKRLDAESKWELKCRSKKSIEDMIALASTRMILTTPTPIEKSAAELDRIPYLFGVQNGVVDLRTGELLKDDSREHYITKRSPDPYIPDAKGPRWDRFVQEICGVQKTEGLTGSPKDDYTRREYREQFLQREAGYWMTGEVCEQKIFIVSGPGSGAKTRFGTSIYDTLGEGQYSTTIPAAMLMEKSGSHSADTHYDSASPYVAGLCGARLAMAFETKKGQRFNINMVKRLTGADYLTGRYLNANPITFYPTHSIVLFTNSNPRIDDLDSAIRDRVIVLSFDRRWNRPDIGERDPLLPDAEKNLDATLNTEPERQRRLAWMIEGAVDYYKNGLQVPEAVKEHTRGYMAEQDALKQFMASQGQLFDVANKRLWTPLKDIGMRYRRWAEANDGGYKSDNEISEVLKERNVQWDRRTAGRFFAVSLKNEPEGGCFLMNDVDVDDLDPNPLGIKRSLYRLGVEIIDIDIIGLAMSDQYQEYLVDNRIIPPGLLAMPHAAATSAEKQGKASGQWLPGVLIQNKGGSGAFIFRHLFLNSRHIDDPLCPDQCQIPNDARAGSKVQTSAFLPRPSDTQSAHPQAQSRDLFGLAAIFHNSVPDYVREATSWRSEIVPLPEREDKSLIETG